MTDELTDRVRSLEAERHRRSSEPARPSKLADLDR